MVRDGLLLVFNLISLDFWRICNQGIGHYIGVTSLVHSADSSTIPKSTTWKPGDDYSRKLGPVLMIPRLRLVFAVAPCSTFSCTNPAFRYFGVLRLPVLASHAQLFLPRWYEPETIASYYKTGVVVKVSFTVLRWHRRASTDRDRAACASSTSGWCHEISWVPERAGDNIWNLACRMCRCRSV